MNRTHLQVARGLMGDAAFFWRLSKHDATAADREVGPARAERARRNARAAFALLAIPEVPTVGSDRVENFQGLEK